jgi:hypothetical protein
METEIFESRDLVVIRWAKNMSCGVKCWCMSFILNCLYRRRLRLALLESLNVIVGGVVESVDILLSCANGCGAASLLPRLWHVENGVVIVLQ